MKQVIITEEVRGTLSAHSVEKSLQAIIDQGYEIVTFTVIPPGYSCGHVIAICRI